jgi:hypothetical protein
MKRILSYSFSRSAIIPKPEKNIKGKKLTWIEMVSDEWLL